MRSGGAVTTPPCPRVARTRCGRRGQGKMDPMSAPQSPRAESGPPWPEPCPAPFSMAGYCLAPGPARPAARAGLVVVGDASAPAEDDQTWTFGQLDDAVRGVAAGLLARGLRPGDRVLLRLGNSSEAAFVFFGAIAARLVAVATSELLAPEEVAAIAADCRPALAVAAPHLAAGLPAGLATLRPEDVRAWVAGGERTTYRHGDPDDPAFLVYTSGTTGAPKGVLHAHRSAWGRRPMYGGWLGLGPGDVMLHAGSLNWTYTLGVGLTDPWANGATAVVYTGPRDPGVWARLVPRRGATIFAAVPGVYRQLLASGALDAADLVTLRHGVTAGEALPPDLFTAWQAATSRPLYEALGMSEISTYVSSGPRTPTRPGSPGRPQPGRRGAVLPAERADGDEPLPIGTTGLLAVHRTDPGLLLGYWERPEEDAHTRRGDWFVGGDLAHLDADGYVWHHGRDDDVMNASGYRVSPQEVERVLSGHPAVADVGVTEVVVRAGVHVIGAFVLPTGDPPFDEHEVRRYAAAHLAAYKVPRLWRTVEELPRTGNAKLRRRDLPGAADPAQSATCETDANHLPG